MRKIRELIRLKYQARLSHEQIAGALAISKGVVAKYVGRIERAGLEPGEWPLLTSANASENLSIPVAQRHACRSPRVLRTHLHAYARRIYGTVFRT